MNNEDDENYGLKAKPITAGIPQVVVLSIYTGMSAESSCQNKCLFRETSYLKLQFTNLSECDRQTYFSCIFEEDLLEYNSRN